MDRLSKNIKSLRKRMGETQEDLAYSIGLDSKSAVANWESGNNSPSQENLKRIAARYRVTVDQLLEDDLSTGFSLLNYLNNVAEDRGSDLLHSIVCLFPIVTIKEEDDLYPKLIEIKASHRHFLECIENEDENSYIYFEKALLAYGELIKQSDCISATANGLSLFLLLIIMIKSYKYFEGVFDFFEIKNKIRRKKEIKRFLLEDLLSKSKDFPDKLRSMVYEDYYKDIMEEIRVLKGDERLFQLGDYYHCLIYIFDIVDNELSTEINQQIGLALLSDLSLMKNKFIKRIENYFIKVGKVQ
ncbi:helix-turn-helix domain-containing protein [Streptococcus mitis]|uniref:helix-turn-helix domain-containing protein n=1 Tax=Streptococcus mitis TaxID=28037 RepID=UPI0021B7F885|nr:helix-turn-helix transcriptional regulator [Streptococcus mitis]